MTPAALVPRSDRDPLILADAVIGRPEHDRLGRFIPALLAMTLAAAAIEVGAAILLAERVLAVAALSTSLFAVGVTLAFREIRRERPLRARVALAITLTIFGAIGAYLVPGVAPSMALLPVLAVVVVLRYVDRNRLLAVAGAAVGSSAAILMIDALAGARPGISALVGTAFHQAILVGVVLLVIAGLADFALEARNSLGDLRVTAERHLRITTARLSIVSSLRLLHAQATPEATAHSIVEALGDLPLIDIAAILELRSAGEASVLALGGHANAPITVGEIVPPARAAYLIERSREGTWAELWSERGMPTVQDDRLSELGLQAQAFAPILSGDVIVGLVVIATTDRAQGLHLIADLPSVSEAAAVAGTILAPALMARRVTEATRVQVTKIIADQAFHPVFQPIIDVRTGVTVGFEALTRFDSGERPDRVFAMAASAGIGTQLEAATLAAAIHDGADLPSEAWLSLNVSPSFLGNYDELASILARRNRPVTLEITEHELIDDYGRLHAAMRALGPDVRLAVDDAGAGVANFRHLVDLRPDLIKIDAGMIRGVQADVSRQALIVGLVHFAEVSGAQVLAEGVETQREQDTVARLGVTLAQGYLMARPAPVATWIEAPPMRPAVPRLPHAPTTAVRPH